MLTSDIFIDDPLELLNTRKYFLNQAFLNAFPAVDSFFLIGGVLAGFLFIKEMTRHPKNLKSGVYWSLYYIHRYIRSEIILKRASGKKNNDTK